MVFGNQLQKVVPIDHELLMEHKPAFIITRGGFAQDPVAPIRTMVDLKKQGLIDLSRLVKHDCPLRSYRGLMTCMKTLRTAS